MKAIYQKPDAELISFKPTDSITADVDLDPDDQPVVGGSNDIW